MVDYLTKWSPSLPPGQSRVYSNPSIGLLGLATAAAYGAPYSKALRNHVLEPLALHDTYIDVPINAQDRYSWGTSAQNERVRVSPAPLDAQAYGIKTTVHDLTKFVSAWLTPRTSPALEEAARPRFSVDGVMQQGLAWEGVISSGSEDALQQANSSSIAYDSRAVDPRTGEACFLNKTGSTNGFSAYVILHRKSRTGFALIANRNIPIDDRLAAARTVLAAMGSFSCKA
jgi:beta-lactamase class C